MRSPQGRGQDGFTLVELMAVVAIVGILALIAVYSVRKYVATAKASEALPIITDIKARQEAYKDEIESYLDVTGSLTVYYPNNPTPGQAKMQWGGGDATIADKWKTLGVAPAGPTYFVYSCIADSGTAAPPDSGITIGNWPTSAQNVPYYVVKAKADLEAGGPVTTYVAPSFSNQIFSENEGE